MPHFYRLIKALITCAVFALTASQSYAQNCSSSQAPNGSGECKTLTATCIKPQIPDGSGTCFTPETSSTTVTLSQCIADPSLDGCAKLIATCKKKPSDPICSGDAATVTIDPCKTNPSLSGCAALCAASPGACPSVTYAQCSATPKLAGCAPLLASCKAKSNDPLCTGGITTLANCLVNPALTGCTALCSANPDACAGKITLAQCSLNPELKGCAALCAANRDACPSETATISKCKDKPTLKGCAALCAVSSCTCAAPKVPQNGVCVTPVTCKPHQELKFGACVTPVVCVAPQVLQAGVCVTPVTTAAQVLSAPNAGVTVDSSGALVVAESTAPLILSSDAQKNALVKLNTLKPVKFTSGNTTLEYTDQEGNAQLVVRTVDNKPHLEVAKGTVQIKSPSAGNTISVMSSDEQKTVGSIVTQTGADSVVVVKTETTAALFVDSGRVHYQGPGQSAPVPVYQGENTQLDADGNLSKITLGSRNGLNQVPGDPLPVQISKDSGTKIPILEGTLPRFDNALSLLDIVGEHIKSVLGDAGGQLSYDRETGVITYMLGNTAYRVIVLGDVLVKLNGFSGTDAAATAGGVYTLASHGIQLSLSGALGYFSDLQTAVQVVDANGALNLKPTGAIEARFGGGRYVIMPGISASLPSNPSPLPGFESDASGYAVFRDHMGTLQTLYPAFLDMDTLNSTFKTVVPTATLTHNGNGAVTVGVAGQNFTLRPQYSVIDNPAGHAMEPYWQENGFIYFRNNDQSTQGFRAE